MNSPFANMPPEAMKQLEEWYGTGRGSTTDPVVEGKKIGQLDVATTSALSNIFGGAKAEGAPAAPKAPVSKQLDERTAKSVASILGVKTVTEEAPAGDTVTVFGAFKFFGRTGKERSKTKMTLPKAMWEKDPAVAFAFLYSKAFGYQADIIADSLHMYNEKGAEEVKEMGDLLGLGDMDSMKKTSKGFWCVAEEWEGGIGLSDADAVAMRQKAVDSMEGDDEMIEARKPKTEGTVKDWLLAKVSAACVACNVPPGQQDAIEDAVLSAALSGKLGDGTLSDLTGRAIVDMVTQLAATLATSTAPTPAAPQVNTLAAEEPVIFTDEAGVVHEATFVRKAGKGQVVILCEGKERQIWMKSLTALAVQPSIVDSLLQGHDIEKILADIERGDQTALLEDEDVQIEATEANGRVIAKVRGSCFMEPDDKRFWTVTASLRGIEKIVDPDGEENNEEIDAAHLLGLIRDALNESKKE